MLLNTIINADCLTAMADIPDHTFDMILTDPPYGVLHKDNPAVQWDRQLPHDKFWPELLRIAKPNAPIIVFAQGRFAAHMIVNGEQQYRYSLVWDKGRGTDFLNANRKPLNSHEDILVFSPNPIKVFHPQYTPVPPSHPSVHCKHADTNQCYGQFNRLESLPPYLPYTDPISPFHQGHTVAAIPTTPIPTDAIIGNPPLMPGKCYDYAHIRRVPPTTPQELKCPLSVLHFKKEHSKSQSWHPTRKPVALLRYLIRTYTNPGDTIFDPCMGSASVAIAAIEEGRNYFGYELDPTIHAHALRDIRRIAIEPSLNL